MRAGKANRRPSNSLRTRKSRYSVKPAAATTSARNASANYRQRLERRDMRRILDGAHSRQQARFASLYLQCEILGVDAALGKTPSDEPEAGLRGARKHVAQLLFIAESPNRADAIGNMVAK